ncbi:MAG TPA: hypothetical protein VHY22_11530 [Chthoniobacteraceae bacterium]|jgi:hypothetical protein|nr:hypothetical protein [Chthoniobacteraceae bacterium]
MSYDFKISPTAKRALESCIKTYGQGDEIHKWLRTLKELASAKIDAGSIDVSEILQDLLENGEKIAKKENWARSWEFLKSADIRQKVTGLYFMLKKREPPVQLRAAKEDFCFLGVITATITVYYEVNHVTQEMVIRYLVGLPGQ